MYLTRPLVAAALTLASVGRVAIAAEIPITPVPPQATLRVATVQVRVTPDHRDWTYQVGEPARFKVAVVADNEPIDNVTVTYRVGPDMMPAEAKTATVPLEGLVIEGGTLSQPGFCAAS